MGRLIDVDALKQDLRKYQIESLIAHNEEKNVFDVINEQPTAYDVERVVDGLEDIKEAVSGCFGTMCSECKYTKKCYAGELSYKVAIDNAISVVKRGGVE